MPNQSMAARPGFHAGGPGSDELQRGDIDLGEE